MGEGEIELGSSWLHGKSFKGRAISSDLCFSFVAMCICVWIGARGCRCLQRPEEGIESPGFELQESLTEP